MAAAERLTGSSTGEDSVGARAAARSALDVMLTDAALEDSGLRRFVKPAAGIRLIAGLARRPDRLASRMG